MSRKMKIYIVMHWFSEDMNILRSLSGYMNIIGVFQDPLEAERVQTDWKQKYGTHNGWVEIREEQVK